MLDEVAADAYVTHPEDGCPMKVFRNFLAELP